MLKILTSCGGRLSAVLLTTICLMVAPAKAASPGLPGDKVPSASGHDDTYLYRLPYDIGATYPVLQAYGSRFSHRGAEHYTVDFRMAVGTPVLSARDGVVVEVESEQRTACWLEGCGRYANRVIVRHADGTFAKYFHLAPGSVEVETGQRVARGARLARSGNTGLTTTPHLHFGVYVQVSDGNMQSIPVRFATRGGPVEPRAGRRYLHPSPAVAVVTGNPAAAEPATGDAALHGG